MERRELLKNAAAIGVALPSVLIAGKASAAANGPVLAVISHPVKDYAAWRAVYDSVEPLRQKFSVTGAEVFHDPKDPNAIVVIHRFASIESMQAFLGDPDLKATMAKAGVLAPPTAVVAIAV